MDGDAPASGVRERALAGPPGLGAGAVPAGGAGEMPLGVGWDARHFCVHGHLRRCGWRGEGQVARQPGPSPRFRGPGPSPLGSAAAISFRSTLEPRGALPRDGEGAGLASALFSARCFAPTGE